METEILNMTKDQLIDYLVENWTELVNEMPKGKERIFFQNHEVDDMRAMALSLANANHLIDCVNSSVS